MKRIHAPHTYTGSQEPVGQFRSGGVLYVTVFPNQADEAFEPFECCTSTDDSYMAEHSKRFIGRDSFKGFGGMVQAPYFSAKNADVEPERLERLASLFKDLPGALRKRVLQLHEHQGTLIAYLLGVGWPDLEKIMVAWQKHNEAHVIICGSLGKYKISGDARDAFFERGDAA